MKLGKLTIIALALCACLTGVNAQGNSPVGHVSYYTPEIRRLSTPLST